MSGASERSRTLALPAAAARPLALFHSDDALKAHPDFVAAKAGDVAAAVRLVADLSPPIVEDLRRAFDPGTIMLPVVAEERSGPNRIPRALAEFCAAVLDGETAQDVVQANRAFHTGASAMERMIARVVFDGPVRAGARYALVDDVSVMGSTLADLADHVQARGGIVTGVILLADAGRPGRLVPSPSQADKVKGRFGDVVEELFAIAAGALTAAEAGYLLNFRDADALRDRATAARRRRSERLGTQGFRRPADE